MASKFDALRQNIRTHHGSIGLALSGGLDSAVVLHELCRVNDPVQVHAYSMLWGPEPDLSRECLTVRDLALAYNVKFTTFSFNPESYWEALDACMRFFDRPRWNVWPWMILQQAQKDGITDFYVGEGCDEIFGYQDRCYLKGWISQLEYIFPVWRQVTEKLGITLHAPFLELEQSLNGPGLPTTLGYHCGKLKEALWDEYSEKLLECIIYPKVAVPPHYYSVLGMNKRQLQLESTRAWLRYHD